MVNIFHNDQLVESIVFPITNVGETNTISVILQNPLKDEIELIPLANDPDVEVIEYPRHLNPMESAKSVWRFSPKKERLTPLKSQIGFREIIG